MENKQTIELNGLNLKLMDVVQIANGARVTLANSAAQKMKSSREYIEKRINSGEVMYGVNTGFGAFSSVRISDNQIEDLQRNLIRSHSMGVGTPFTVRETRAIMALRANALSRGHSGIRVDVVDKILEFLNAGVIPVIPSQGSVGASGDLAPLSHLALALIGEGDVWEDGKAVDVQTVLKKKNIQPLTLKAKEGLSLINGCQVMTAVGLLALDEALQLAKLADVVGAMSLEGLKGSRSAFNPLIAETRPHPGERKTAGNLRTLLTETSEIAKSHEDCNKVQDAYSLRCMPAVHGAVKDGLQYILNILETEANSSTDNPLVFSDENIILSCGNFHGMPVAFAMDYASIVMSSLGSISEARISKLINPAMSELPAFLIKEGGLNSGHMIVQVAAASLVSENKVLSHPASVDTIPTSADKEDHVSMGTIAARKFKNIVENVKNVIAMEFLCATQALDLLTPLKAPAPIHAAYLKIREQVPYAAQDRIFSKDVEKIKSLIENRQLLKKVEEMTGELK